MPSPSLFELCLKTRRIQTLLVELERVFYVKENITKKKSGVSKKMNGFWVGLRSASSNKLLCWWGGYWMRKDTGLTAWFGRDTSWEREEKTWKCEGKAFVRINTFGVEAVWDARKTILLHSFLKRIKFHTLCVQNLGLFISTFMIALQSMIRAKQSSTPTGEESPWLFQLFLTTSEFTPVSFLLLGSGFLFRFRVHANVRRNPWRI